MADTFTVSISNLSSGGQLVCSNDISVGFTQPADVGSSVLGLTIDAPGAMIRPPPSQVMGTSGSKTFNIQFPVGTTLSGKTVTATIRNDGTVQASDSKTDISVSCTLVESGGTNDDG